MQGGANFALRRRNAANSIHTHKFRLCKSIEKNCSEAGSYYSDPAYYVALLCATPHFLIRAAFVLSFSVENVFVRVSES